MHIFSDSVLLPGNPKIVIAQLVGLMQVVILYLHCYLLLREAFALIEYNIYQSGEGRGEMVDERHSEH